MPNFSKPLPPARSTGDAGPAADVNAIVAAITEVKALVPDAYTDAKAVAANTAAVAAKYVKPSAGVPLADVDPAATSSLRDRSTHTGAQPTSTVTGLDAALAAKYVKPATGIPASAMTTDVQSALNAAGTAGYTVPAGGIPRFDLAAEIGASLTRADASVQWVNSQAEADALPANTVALIVSDIGQEPYVKPATGIPTTDLSTPIRDLLVAVASNNARLTALESSVEQVINPPTAAPTALTLTAAPGDKKIIITRAGGDSTTTTGGTTGTTYALYRGATATGTPVATTFPYTDTALVNGTAVSYIATAKNSKGTTTSAVVTATPTGTVVPEPVAIFRASDITGVASGGLVANAPAGGFGPAWAQPEATLQPTYNPAYNGRAAIYCNGGYLSTSAGVRYPAAEGMVAAWVWFPGSPNSATDQCIASADIVAGSDSIRLWQLNGSKPGLAKVVAWNGGNSRADTTSGVTGGKWQLIAGRWGGNRLESYVDGVSDGSTSGTLSAAIKTIPIVIGLGNTSPVYGPTKAYISEVRAFYRPITDDEAKAIFTDMGLVTS